MGFFARGRGLVMSCSAWLKLLLLELVLPARRPVVYPTATYPVPGDDESLGRLHVPITISIV